MRQDYLKLFKENYSVFIKSVAKLSLSLERAKKINIKDIRSIDLLEENDLETLETLVSRFARTTDILINKVFRSLDALEQEENLRKLDILIRAEKRGFVDDYKILIDLKNLRNDLVHEYIEEEFLDIFQEIIIKTPLLLAIKDKLEVYLKKYKYL